MLSYPNLVQLTSESSEWEGRPNCGHPGTCTYGSSLVCSQDNWDCPGMNSQVYSPLSKTVKDCKHPLYFLSSEVSSDGRVLDWQLKVQLASKSSKCEGRPFVWLPRSCSYMAALLYIHKGNWECSGMNRPSDQELRVQSFEQEYWMLNFLKHLHYKILYTWLSDI